MKCKSVRHRQRRCVQIRGLRPFVSGRERLTAVSHVRSLGDRSSWGWSFKSQGCFGVQVKNSVAVRRFVEAKQLLNQSDGTPFECQVRRSNMPLVG